ncbi:FIST signal transduction protein [Teredinibacter purpureus]|uniref:FIST signal transduction protein n=1 Tax=Teredinibacter purpureus TaxID=2731756 RepID=UPI0005F858D6|nr:FIST N-terminal domain-containing protein [Teredinibacter purpureus]
MNSSQSRYENGIWQPPLAPNKHAQLVTVFGSHSRYSEGFQHIKTAFPNAEIIGCTTSGEIVGAEIYDDTLCLTALEFVHAKISVATVCIHQRTLEAAINTLASNTTGEDLKYLLVLSDGQLINGSQLVEGLKAYFPNDLLITGGLAGDGTRFEHTTVWHNDDSGSGKILTCAFYGKELIVGHGSMGGWDPFGPEREITRSRDNILLELDHKPALQLYKTYLGDHAKNLPSSALLYPLLITKHGEDEAIIRTILNIDENNSSMIFAGDMPKGATAQLMRANFDRLIDGAEAAAETALKALLTQKEHGLVLMISCVGRRLVLNQRTEEELEAVAEIFGDNWSYTGFYSYGEIAPLMAGSPCMLHNQTMTITTITERNA